MKIKLIVGLVAGLMSTQSFAANDFSYNHFDFGVGKVGDFSVISVGGITSLTEHVYLDGYLYDGSDSDKNADLNEYGVALGGHNAIPCSHTLNTDVFYQAGIHRIDIKTPGVADVSDTGITIKAGVKTDFSIPALNVSGYAGVDRNSDIKNAHFFGIAADYSFSQWFSFGIDYTHKLDNKTAITNVKYHF